MKMLFHILRKKNMFDNETAIYIEVDKILNFIRFLYERMLILQYYYFFVCIVIHFNPLKKFRGLFVIV